MAKNPITLRIIVRDKAISVSACWSYNRGVKGNGVCFKANDGI